ncbi:O10A5 protein, partial [Polypterus senegalus]|nr:O10A5 protein [Polypterus senegalus]
MYFLVCNLSLADIIYISTSLPKLMSRYLLDDKVISYNGCFTQMYFFLCLSALESYILVAMAFDRFLAICQPLRYPTLMNGRNSILLAVFGWTLGFITPIKSVSLTQTMDFCGPNKIYHCICDYSAVIKLACNDISGISTQGLVTALSIIIIPFTFIVFTYINIGLAVTKIKSSGRAKAFSTCVAHLLIVVFFYISATFVFVSYRIQNVSTDFRILGSLQYAVIPPLLNPFIYSFRNKDIPSLKMNGSLKEFVLIGFSSMSAEYYTLIFAAALLVYVLTVCGNLMLVVIIMLDKKLHSPMYFLVCNLSLADICFVSTTLPKLMLRYLVDDKVISYNGCFTQMYFFLFLSSLEAYILIAMAFDRFLAICKPLRYPVLMNSRNSFLLAVFLWTLGFITPIKSVSLTQTMDFCGPNKIYHCICDYSAVIKLACNDISPLSIQGLVTALSLVIIPFSFIVFTYVKIGIAVSKLKSSGRAKAFSTCVAHLVIVFCFYFSEAFVFISYRIQNVSTDLRILGSLQYAVLPPLLNPLIYSFRNKDIRDSIKRKLKVNLVEKRQIEVTVITN